MTEAGAKKKTVVILIAVLLVSCVYIFHDFLFGDYVLAYMDVGTDTYDQYLMHYQTIINHLREGSFSLWDFCNGYGINMYSLNMFDPFLMLLYACGVLSGPEVIYHLLVYVQILRILLAGLAIYGFLSCFCLSERSKLIASYIYALCGYMVVWGQHYQFGTLLVLLPLLLMAAEKALKKPRWYLGLTLLCGVCAIDALYFSYMQFIVLGVYFLFRISWRERLFGRKGLLTLAKSYGSMLLGIGIGLVNLLPSGNTIVNVSGRVTAKPLAEKLLDAVRFYGMNFYKTLFKRFFSSNLEGITEYSGYSNYYEAPNVFFSALFIIAAVCFVWMILRRRPQAVRSLRGGMSNGEASVTEGGAFYSRKQKCLLLLAMAACTFTIVMPMGGLIFNGFAYPFSRHTFVCMPFFAWLVAAFLHEVFENRGLCLPVFGLVSAAVIVQYLRVHVPGAEYLPVTLTLGAAGIIVCLFLAARAKRTWVRQAAAGGLLICAAVTMCVDAWYSYNERAALEKAPSAYFDELYDENVSNALAWLKETDDSFYRVEKDYTIGSRTSSLNALAQNYMPVSTYNSSLNVNLREFVKKLWPNLNIADNAHFSYANAVYDSAQASLSHVKYILSRNAALNVDGYELLKQFGNIYVYRNRSTEALGKFYTKALTSEDFENSAGTADRDKLLTQAVICDTADDLTETDGTLLETCRQQELAVDAAAESTEEGIRITLPVREGSVRLEFDLQFPKDVPYVYIQYGEYYTMVRAEKKTMHVELNIPESIDMLEITCPLPYETFVALRNVRVYETEEYDFSALSEGISFSAGEKDSVVSGTANVTEKGILFVPVPYEDGWTALVDGEKTEIRQVDYGFCGIMLEPGEHEIQMVYKCPGFAAGAAGSIFFLVLTAVIWAALGYRAKRKADKNGIVEKAEMV